MLVRTGALVLPSLVHRAAIRREHIQLIVGAYALRNETIVQLLLSKRVINENVRPDELIDILLHEEIDTSSFVTIATAARQYFETLTDEEQTQLLKRGSSL